MLVLVPMMCSAARDADTDGDNDAGDSCVDGSDDASDGDGGVYHNNSGNGVFRNCWAGRKADKGRSCPECGRGQMVSTVTINKVLPRLPEKSNTESQYRNRMPSHDAFQRESQSPSAFKFLVLIPRMARVFPRRSAQSLPTSRTKCRYVSLQMRCDRVWPLFYANSGDSVGRVSPLNPRLPEISDPATDTGSCQCWLRCGAANQSAIFTRLDVTADRDPCLRRPGPPETKSNFKLNADTDMPA